MSTMYMRYSEVLFNVYIVLQLSGLGKIRPNTLVVGFKNNWTKCSDEEVEEYVSLLQFVLFYCI